MATATATNICTLVWLYSIQISKFLKGLEKGSLSQEQTGTRMDKWKLSSGSSDQIDDIRWLCSLNESELDFLMSLKVMILQRAKDIDAKAMDKNIGLKFLRALSFILINKLKGQLEGVPGCTGSSSHLDRCKLLKFDLDDAFKSLSMEELSTYICSEKSKRALSAFFEDVPPPPPPPPPSKKPKFEG